MLHMGIDQQVTWDLTEPNWKATKQGSKLPCGTSQVKKKTGFFTIKAEIKKMGLWQQKQTDQNQKGRFHKHFRKYLDES